MTVESERGTSDRGVDAESTPTPVDAPNNSIDAQYDAHFDTFGAEDSPELLRTRADSLLDEMMLGAVDVSAADFSADPNATGYGASGERTPEPGQNGSSNGHPAYGQSAGANGSDPPYTSTHSRNGKYASGGYAANEYGSSEYGSSEYGSGGYASNGYTSTGNGSSPAEQAAPGGPSNAAYGSPAPSSSVPAGEVEQRQNGYEAEEATPQPTPEWKVKTGGSSGGGDDVAWNEYVTSFRSPSGSSGQIQKWQPDSPADGYAPSRSGASDQANSSSSAAPASGARSTGPTQPAAASSEYAPAAQTSPAPPSGDDDGRRSDAASMGYVSAMAVMPKGPRRSSLLPRMSRFDVDSLNREIADLHEEIRALLPVGHDQAERGATPVGQGAHHRRKRSGAVGRSRILYAAGAHHCGAHAAIPALVEPLSRPAAHLSVGVDALGDHDAGRAVAFPVSDGSLHGRRSRMRRGMAP